VTACEGQVPDSPVEVLSVEAVPTAVRDGQATRTDLSTVIRRLLDDVWAHVRQAGDLEPGHNVVVYRGNLDAGPTPIEVGVQVARPFDEASATGVHCSELPAGRAAHVTHRGPYQAIALAYQAILTWAEQGGHQLGDMSWEVYGDWAEDPDQLVTDIYFLLA
jgi:effector-binding domain-containing protein